MSTAPPNSSAYTFRVRYFETDQMHVAHHANYLVWFESARSEYCRDRGIDYTTMEKQGMFLPILEAKCRYKLPARYDDELTVHTFVREITRRTLHMGYSVTRDGVEIASGETTQMLIGENGRPRSFPEEISVMFK